jgi:3-oxoadipate enol-lactonase
MKVTSGTALAKDGASLAYTLREPPHPPKARIAMVHALAMDRSNWDAVIEALPAHSAVLTFDCRGHGASSPGAGTFSVELFADDLANIMEEIGWDTAVIAGCSMGGCVSQAFAARHAERTEALLLIDTTAWYGPTAAADWQGRADRARKEGFAAMSEFQVGRWFTDGFRQTNPNVVEKTLSVFLANDVEAYEATCRMLGAADLRNSARDIKCPTTIIVGRDDYATPVAAAVALNEAIPGSNLQILEDARHFTPVERPQDIADALANLCMSVQRAESK